jgi:hypothetical protein
MKIVANERLFYRVLILGLLAATWLIGTILARTEFSRSRSLAAADAPRKPAAAPTKKPPAPAAAVKPAPAPEWECRRASGPITIDGAADEDAWKNAAVIDQFQVGWQQRPALSATRARMLWDDQGLYFFADMDDHDLYADIVEHDGMCWLNDVFELFFKPAVDKPGYYELQVNAAGTMLDMYIPSRGAGGYARFAKSQSFTWRSAVALRGTLADWQDQDEGWSVEGMMPWEDFAATGGIPKAGDAWRFALCRYDYSVDYENTDLSSTAPLTAADFHRYEDYGLLRFVGNR